MNRQYGFRGSIVPTDIGSRLNEAHMIDGIEILIKDSVFEVGYDTQTDEQKARKIANNLINSWRVRNNVKLSVDFHQTWQPNPQGGKDIGLTRSETLHVTDRAITITTRIIKGVASIIKPFGDSYRFTNDIEIAKKALTDNTLSESLKFFGEEVVDDDKPLYGIYKAIEVITDHLSGDGRDALGRLAGENKKFVSDVMETANFSRHGNPQGRNLLSESECKDRARILLQAYASSI